MLWIKQTQLCAVVEEWPNPDLQPDECDGPIEADHAGKRGLGRNCSDSECIAVCRRHHRQRHDCGYSFRGVTRERMREWLDASIRRTQVLYAEYGEYGGDW